MGNPEARIERVYGSLYHYDSKAEKAMINRCHTGQEAANYSFPRPTRNYSQRQRDTIRKRPINSQSQRETIPERPINSHRLRELFAN